MRIALEVALAEVEALQDEVQAMLDPKEPEAEEAPAEAAAADDEEGQSNSGEEE